MSYKKKYPVITRISVSAVLFLLCFLGLFLEKAFTEKVYADIIIEPQGDFYKKYRENCRVDDRTYIVKEPGAPAFTEPGGRFAGYYEGGTEVHSIAIYFEADGEGAGTGPGVDVSGKWICFHSSGGECWIRWGDCDLKYDHISFMEEHRDEVVNINEAVDSEFVIFYTYPESGEIAGSTEGLRDLGWTDEVCVNKQYTDSEGKRWGYVSYYYGRMDAWVCLDDPTNAELDLKEDSGTGRTDLEKKGQDMEQDDYVEEEKDQHNTENAGGDQNIHEDDGFKYIILISLATVIAVTIGVLEYHRRK